MSITGLLLSSLLLIIAASAALVFGWANASEPLVISSVAFSAASAIFMAMGLSRSRPRRAAAPVRKPQKKGKKR